MLHNLFHQLGAGHRSFDRWRTVGGEPQCADRSALPIDHSNEPRHVAALLSFIEDAQQCLGAERADVYELKSVLGSQLASDIPVLGVDCLCSSLQTSVGPVGEVGGETRQHVVGGSCALMLGAGEQYSDSIQ
ncbi:MAG: hypothetical protein B7Y93_03900 [Micrococcales bacterium 32-70-13]|nr:MAG: hypothetical protein B7Y93_03900 [Micrococcales bacterium 32-70-13]